MNRREFVAAAGTAALAGTLPASQAKEANTRKFQLGIVTYNIAARWDLPTVLRVCKNAGIAAVELRSTHKHGVEVSLSAAQRKTVRKRFEDSGVVCWGCGSTCEYHSPDAAVVRKNIETCKRFSQLVADVGGKGVKVRPNGLPKGVPPEKTLAQIGKALAQCGKAAADVNVEIWVEVHGRGTSHPPHVKTFMEQCGHPSVGITWNSNAGDIKNGSVAEYFKLLKPWLRSVHINQLFKDSTGAYPYRELFRLLRESGYDRYTLAELGRGMPEPAFGEEFLRYYKALWQELAGG